tara:strand:+ start:618 stop:1304 length:687 start_codon:yes stop_codon:yes gene_type:complete
MAINVALKAGKAVAKKVKSSYDDLKKAQAARRKKMAEEKTASARSDKVNKPKPKEKQSIPKKIKELNRDIQKLSGRERGRRDRTGSSGLKVGTEEALGKGAIGLMGGAIGTGIVGGGIAIDKAAKERGRKRKERFRKMQKVARKAESEGKKTFTYEGKKYDVDPRYSSGMIGSGDVTSYFTPVKTKSKSEKPVKKAVGGMIQAAKTITKKKTASRNKASATKWETKWG